MQALYEGRRDDAVAMAVDITLDQFEAAALGHTSRLRAGSMNKAWTWTAEATTGSPHCTSQPSSEPLKRRRC